MRLSDGTEEASSSYASRLPQTLSLVVVHHLLRRSEQRNFFARFMVRPDGICATNAQSMIGEG